MQKKNNRHHRQALWLGLALTLLFNTGCSRLALLFTPKYAATLTVQATPVDSTGRYQLSGTTNLPEGTSLAIAALRYLQPRSQTAAAQNPTYAILDYREATVQQGRWQTDLALWEVAANGDYREPWQIEQAELGLATTPDPNVIFVATLAPLDLPKLQAQLAEQKIQLVSNDINMTEEGDRFLQASQQMAIALPTGKTAPPTTRPEDINGGWGNRYLILPEPPNTIELERPAQRETDAPMTPAETMR